MIVFKFAKHLKLPKMDFDKIKPYNPFPFHDSSDLINDKIENVQRLMEEFAVKVIDMHDRALINAVIDFAVREGITDLFLIDEEFVRSALFREMELRNANERCCVYCGSRLDKRGAE